MNRFTIKDSLSKLKEKNYDPKITKTITILERLEEEQLQVISQTHGIKIDGDIIRIYFKEGIGFRCFNENIDYHGRLPICKNIERFLNKLYLESFETDVIKS